MRLIFVRLRYNLLIIITKKSVRLSNTRWFFKFNEKPILYDKTLHLVNWYLNLITNKIKDDLIIILINRVLFSVNLLFIWLYPSYWKWTTKFIFKKNVIIILILGNIRLINGLKMPTVTKNRINKSTTVHSSSILQDRIMIMNIWAKKGCRLLY